MNPISTRLIAFFCAAGVSVCATGATPPVSDAAKIKAPPVFGQLAPADIQAIQGLGRAVLAAKGTPDPSQEALRNDMKALGATLDQTLTAALMTPPVLRLGKGRTLTVVPNDVQTPLLTVPTHQYKFVAGPDGKVTLEVPTTPVAAPIPEVAIPSSQRPSRTTSAGKDRYATVRNQLASARQRTDLLTASPQSHDKIRNARTAGLLSKAKTLHDEVGAALDTPSADSVSKLIKLRDRLRPKTLAQVLAEREMTARQAGEPIPEPTPTISVITRHR